MGVEERNELRKGLFLKRGWKRMLGQKEILGSPKSNSSSILGSFGKFLFFFFPLKLLKQYLIFN